MKFVPAGEIIGEAHQVRTVRIMGSDQLPDGAYQFIDMYCTDPSCDCRKTIIQVFHNENHVSTIDFGWESREFYEKWMGAKEDATLPSMHGASLDFSSPDRVSPQGMLALFNALCDDQWVGIFKAHYAAVKKKLVETPMKDNRSRTGGYRTARHKSRRR